MGAKVVGAWLNNCRPYTGSGEPAASSAKSSNSDRAVRGPNTLVGAAIVSVWVEVESAGVVPLPDSGVEADKDGVVTEGT
jgi:hypothetical protein